MNEAGDIRGVPCTSSYRLPAASRQTARSVFAAQATSAGLLTALRIVVTSGARSHPRARRRGPARGPADRRPVRRARGRHGDLQQRRLVLPRRPAARLAHVAFRPAASCPCPAGRWPRCCRRSGLLSERVHDLHLRRHAHQAFEVEVPSVRAPRTAAAPARALPQLRLLAERVGERAGHGQPLTRLRMQVGNLEHQAHLLLVP